MDSGTLSVDEKCSGLRLWRPHPWSKRALLAKQSQEPTSNTPVPVTHHVDHDLDNRSQPEYHHSEATTATAGPAPPVSASTRNATNTTSPVR
jgi:hypothetical protein